MHCARPRSAKGHPEQVRTPCTLMRRGQGSSSASQALDVGVLPPPEGCGGRSYVSLECPRADSSCWPRHYTLSHRLQCQYPIRELQFASWQFCFHPCSPLTCLSRQWKMARVLGPCLSRRRRARSSCLPGPLPATWPPDGEFLSLRHSTFKSINKYLKEGKG